MTSIATRAKPLGGASRSNRSSFRSPTDYQATPHERFVFAMLNLVGKHVTVTVKTGQEYVGILSTCPADKDVGVVLSMAREKLRPEDKVPAVQEKMVFLSKDFVQLVANDVDLYNDEVVDGARKNQGEVLADSEIEVAGRGAGAERELEAASAWLTSGVDPSLELGSKSDMKAWDQFSFNEQHHGVVSSYSDELYTTKISDKQFTPEQLAQAERLAREIESKATTNAHVAEERGQKEMDDDDGDMDEEEKYSMVLDPSRVDATSAAAATPPPVQSAASVLPKASPAEPAAPPAATVPAAPAAAPQPGAKFKLRPQAVEFVPAAKNRISSCGPTPPQGAPPAPPQGAPPQGGGAGMYQMQGAGAMMPMQGALPMSPGGPMPQQGMMGVPMSHEQAAQAQHAAQQQQQQQMAMIQRAQMPPGGAGMMVPMQPNMRPGMVMVPPAAMPGGPVIMAGGMMGPTMMPGIYPSGGARPVPPQQPMPPRMHGPPAGPRMMPPVSYPQGGMPPQQMAMRGQPPYSPTMAGYAAPPMQPRPPEG